MKYTVTALAAVIAIMSLTPLAHAHEDAIPSHTGQEMPCPMMKDMQGDMKSMMDEMGGMMKMMSDPAMKEHMQKMHEHMGTMMQKMEGMGQKKDGAPAAASPEDHEAHHPGKK